MTAYYAKPPKVTLLNRGDPAAEGLFAAWAFSEGAGLTAYNSTSPRLSAAMTSGASWSSGGDGKAMKTTATSGNGVNTAVTGLGNPSTTPFSMSVRAAITSVTGTQGVFALRLNNSGGSFATSIGIRSAGAWKVEGYGSGAAPNLSSGVTPTAKQYYTVTYTWDGTTGRIYLDGVEKANNTTAPMNYTPGHLYIGTFGGDFDPSQALISGAWLWSVALPARLVQVHALDPFRMFRPRRLPVPLMAQAAATLDEDEGMFHQPVSVW